MTPGARIAAAAQVLDKILLGEAAERGLLRWARSSRFAGSKDRAAVRDLVFDALRCRRSYAAIGGAETGRGLMVGRARAQGLDLECLFSGEGYALAPVSNTELGRAPSSNEALDCPDWLYPLINQSLGAKTDAVLGRLQSRAPVFLRVALNRTTRDAAQARLAQEGIATDLDPLATTALRVTEGARRVSQSATWRDGWIELQDAASQAVCEAIDLPNGGAVLDYCAGGGGKALALAARGARVVAHDADPRRTADLPTRAERAGLRIEIRNAAQISGMTALPLVVADVPCSGSGAWRRQPDGKWLLTQERLNELTRTQAEILDRASDFVAHGGSLAYVTCSFLECENDAQIEAFLARNPAFDEVNRRQWTPLDGGDGFFLARLVRESVSI